MDLVRNVARVGMEVSQWCSRLERLSVLLCRLRLFSSRRSSMATPGSSDRHPAVTQCSTKHRQQHILPVAWDLLRFLTFLISLTRTNALSVARSLARTVSQWCAYRKVLFVHRSDIKHGSSDYLNNALLSLLSTNPSKFWKIVKATKENLIWRTDSNGRMLGNEEGCSVQNDVLFRDVFAVHVLYQCRSCETVAYF